MGERVVFCLCAAWCGTCRDYDSVFRTIAQAHDDYRFVWVDIEDESDAIGDLDIETFPTVLVADGEQVRFFGPVLPAASHLRSLLNRPTSDVSLAADTPATRDLLGRLRAL